MNTTQPVSSKGPIIAFAGILLVGILLAIFFFILPKSKDGDDVADNGGGDSQGQVTDTGNSGGNPSTTPNTPAATGDPNTTSNPQTPATPNTTDAGQPSPYLTDSVLVSDLVGKLKQGDVAGFAELAGPKAASDAVVTQLKDIFVTKQFSVDPEKPLVDAGAEGDAGKRWTINLIPNAANIGLGPQKIDLQLLKDPNLGWSVSNIGAPNLGAVAAAPNTTPNSNPAPNNPNTTEPAPAAAGKLDAAGTAKEFLAAVIARNFQNAKKHVQSDKLSDERLAALFIVIDEGKFQPHSETPLIPTVNQDTVSWFIAKLVSDARQSEFGIEMNRADANANWKIVGLNFDQLMQKVASAAGAGEVAYTDIRTDLRGGESLVLFFGFDDDDVNPRASRQLQIIADILKQDEKRTLSINGHADARGEEDYNERLSNSRASKVRQTLLSMGVPPGQLITKAFGESAPKAPNFNPDGTDNTSGQAQNRRAEVYLEF